MRKGKSLYLAAAVLVGAVLATSVSAASPPGVTSSSILIGGTTPLSGPASAFASVAKGASAYFKYVNARGGVNRRKINYKYVDDGYDPSRTVEQTRELVQRDHVFAVFNSLGTEQNLAVRSYLNQLDVPQLFVASGATTWGRDYKRYPWTIGFQLDYFSEGKIYGRYVARVKPKARIGILYQNDDYGKDLIKGLKAGLGAKTRLIVEQRGYDVTDDNVRSQIIRLKSKRANTLMLFATPKFVIQAYVYAHQLKWRPQVFVNAVGSASNVIGIARNGGAVRETEGSISVVFVKDPTDPRWSRDAGVRLYRSILKKYGGRANPKDVYNMYAMAVAFTMTDVLKKAGRNLTRAKVRDAAAHLNVRNNPFLLPGIVVRTTSRERFPLDQAKLERYHNGRWVYFGGLFSVR